MLAIYQDKVEKDVCYETLSEDEPTVYEFKTWMQDISDFIKEKGQRKLVLVFDNMDRLPAEKVKELWSSIHTFFADSGFENVWAVIPFDETHLACAFGDETDEQTKQLTKYFINKTFPIVYRVAPQSWLRTIGINSARIYFSGTNLLTWAAYDQYDPELNGIVSYFTPPLKTFAFGLELKF